MSVKAELSLSLENISKSFGRGENPHVVLKSFSMDVLQGEFLSIFGPNGCGKSTLLHLIAGILDPEEGKITHHYGENPDRSCGIVFQNYEKSLMPWRTCLDNIIFPLESLNYMTKGARREKARSILEELDLDLPLDHYPYQMSGGQKQLTCIARAMVRRPSLLLLDEPFASLDYSTRMDMQETLQNIWQKTGVTTIFISHEIDEAIFLADRLLLLTPRPARAAEWFKINLPRPRDLASFSSGDFVELRSRIIARFHREVTA